MLELKLRLGLPDPDPEGWGEPVIVLLPITSVGESKAAREGRPWSMVAILRPHSVLGRCDPDGKPAIPGVPAAPPSRQAAEVVLRE